MLGRNLSLQRKLITTTMKKMFFTGILVSLTVAFAVAQPAQKKQIVKTTEYNIVDQAKELDHTTLFNAEGLKTEETEYFADGVVKSKIIYEYNSEKQCVKAVKYGSKGKIEKLSVFEYNADGELVKEISQFPDRRYKVEKVYEYTYK